MSGAEAQTASKVVWITLVDPESDCHEPLAQALGCPVVVVGPSLPDADFESLGEARGIVVDWELGPRCALDLIEALKRDPHTREVPVSLATGEPTRVRVAACVAAGADTVVQRPWDAHELRSRIRLRRDPHEDADSTADGDEHEDAHPTGDGDEGDARKAGDTAAVQDSPDDDGEGPE